MNVFGIRIDIVPLTLSILINEYVILRSNLRFCCNSWRHCSVLKFILEYGHTSFRPNKRSITSGIENSRLVRSKLAIVVLIFSNWLSKTNVYNILSHRESLLKEVYGNSECKTLVQPLIPSHNTRAIYFIDIICLHLISCYSVREFNFYVHFCGIFYVIP